MNTPSQHTLGQSIILHLLPGAVGTLVFILCAPFFLSKGYPSILVFLIAAGAVITPFQLGYLLWYAKRATGRISLSSVVDLRDPLPKWQYVVFPLGMVAWAFLASGALGIPDQLIAKDWFGWLPKWYSLLDIDQLRTFPRQILVISFWTGIALNGFIAPITEELYFRGHLLPRIPTAGKWSPLINISLFSLYHFWAPAQFFSRVVSLLPWGYIVWRKKNIYLMMIGHCTINILGWLLQWGQILGK